MAAVWYSVAILLAFSVALPTHVLCFQTGVPWQRNFLSDQDRTADLETSETATNYAIVNQRREDNSPQIKLPPFLFQQAPNGLYINTRISSLALEADVSNGISFKPPSPPTFLVSENRLTSSEGSGGNTQLYSMWCGCTIECPCPDPECECSIAGCIDCSDDEIGVFVRARARACLCSCVRACMRACVCV